MTEISHFQQIFEKYIQQIGMETFYFCQCGSRESYYEELELMANGGRIKRNQTVYQDTVWCPFAYERGEWHSYPSYSKKLLFPPSSNVKKDGSKLIFGPAEYAYNTKGSYPLFIRIRESYTKVYVAVR